MKEKLESMFGWLLILVWLVILLSMLIGCMDSPERLREPITYTKKEEKLECEIKVITNGNVMTPMQVCKEK